MEESRSWEANSFSANQAIPCILRKTKGFFAPFTKDHHQPLSWARQICSIPHFIFNDPFIYASVFPFMPLYSKWSLYLSFPQKTLYATLLFHMHALFPADLILVDHITQIISCEKYKLRFSLRSSFQSPATSNLLGPSSSSSHNRNIYLMDINDKSLLANCGTEGN